MRICRARGPDGAVRIAALDGERVVPLAASVEALLAARGAADPAGEAARRVPQETTAFLAASAHLDETVREAAARPAVVWPAGDCTLLCPLPAPGKAVGIGRNYGAHAAEGGLAAQEKPRIFLKAPSAAIGPGEPIRRPAGIEKLDFEGELAAVVGRPMTNVAEADALDHVAGYTVLNDVSARELQFDVTPPQTSFAKSMDTFMPTGPVIVTTDAIGDVTDLTVRTLVNGALMQEGHTGDLIFPVPVLLSYLSRFMTLHPGDVVATGTPAGVGHFRDPPVYLKGGDTVRVEIDGIGALENPVVEE